MASFNISNNPDTREEEEQVKQDAQAALTKCEKDEAETDEKVKEWTKANKKWLKRKKKQKKQETGEVVVTGGESSEGAKKRLMEKLCENFKPQFLLSDDGNLQAKNTWRTAMEKYTRYLRDCTNIPEDLYYDLFASMRDADMQKKLQNIKGIKKMSEKEIWNEIEKFFLSSNPIYIRRVQALETRIIKGEAVRDDCKKKCVKFGNMSQIVFNLIVVLTLRTTNQGGKFHNIVVITQIRRVIRSFWGHNKTHF